MKCNKCWNELEPKTKSVASSCGHLFCEPPVPYGVHLRLYSAEVAKSHFAIMTIP